MSELRSSIVCAEENVGTSLYMKINILEEQGVRSNERTS